MKKERTKDLLLEQVRKIPIIQVACEKIGVARATVYRWKTEDEPFRTKLEQALAEGEALINDMGESQLLSLMKEKSWPAISFWLRHRNPKFRERLEVTTNVKSQDALSEEQQAIVQEALRLASLTQDDKAKEDSHEFKKENNDTPQPTIKHS